MHMILHLGLFPTGYFVTSAAINMLFLDGAICLVQLYVRKSQNKGISKLNELLFINNLGKIF